MISENHKFIYVHIIKTGGTSLEKILKQRHPVMIKHPQKIRGKFLMEYQELFLIQNLLFTIFRWWVDDLLMLV